MIFHFPFVLQIDVTPWCNLSCMHCRTSHGASGEFGSKEWINILDPIFNAFPGKIQWVAIGGGEPTLYPDLKELIAYVSKKTRIVLLMTNGTIIAKNPLLLDELIAAGLNRIQLSLESPDCNIHDQIRGTGNFELVLAAASICRERNIDLAFRMTLNGLNWTKYREFVSLCERLGAKEANLRKVIPVGNAEAYFAWNCISQENHKKILEDFLGIQKMSAVLINSEDPFRFVVDPRFSRRGSGNKEGFRGCPAGTTHAYINPEGKVRPCSNVPEILGDLKTQSFLEIWNNHEWMKRLRKRDYEKCVNCRFKNICGGCRAMAKHHTGDWWGVDPDCWI